MEKAPKPGRSKPYHRGERDEPVSLHPLDFAEAMKALLVTPSNSKKSEKG